MFTNRQHGNWLIDYQDTLILTFNYQITLLVFQHPFDACGFQTIFPRASVFYITRSFNIVQSRMEAFILCLMTGNMRRFLLLTILHCNLGTILISKKAFQYPWLIRITFALQGNLTHVRYLGGIWKFMTHFNFIDFKKFNPPADNGGGG